VTDARTVTPRLSFWRRVWCDLMGNHQLGFPGWSRLYHVGGGIYRCWLCGHEEDTR
jgi:hypothetical protein